MQLGQHAPARRTIVHLSDTHLLAGNAPLGGLYDAEANLVRTLGRLERMAEDGAVRIDALVFTGDLTDLGEPGAYLRLRELVEPVAARLDAPVVWVAGNHDERPELRRDLLGLSADEQPVTGVWDLGGLRLVALDSSVPGWHHGEIDEEQRQWLRDLLATPAPLGTILALHHPPLPSHVPLFDILELRDQPALADAIAGSDVRAILAGHLHYSMNGVFAGVPVSVAAASCYTMDVARPPLRVNGMDAGQTFQLVHVYDDTVTHTVVPVDADDPAAFFTPDWYERMARLTPQQRLEEFSRKPPRP
ncbi:metallophosphoesterase [Microbacterium marinilacus]|uniref:3',5'-cyclic adenosine monophosphate phosphodiesterase CpdA n=1 Tax=Microbacterium marinilacus TaxID=415209 RepID=A0ABP7BP76_9MICO|nr:metallophosphoesterase [Microbacterium marinilacus]MBY0689900.1 metallophosphoesterase [Microbacterium marinilacus]